MNYGAENQAITATTDAITATAADPAWITVIVIAGAAGFLGTYLWCWILRLRHAEKRIDQINSKLNQDGGNNESIDDQEG